MQNCLRRVVGRRMGNGPFRTEITTWVHHHSPWPLMMECNKLCDEHTIAGSLSNLADGRAARMWGRQVSSRAHHPSILFLFERASAPPSSRRSGCMLPVWDASGMEIDPSQRQAQASNHMGLICALRMLWPQVSTLPGPHRRPGPICHGRGSVRSNVHNSDGQLNEIVIHFSVYTAWEKCHAD